MADTPYRIVQWATGSIGQIGIRHFVDNPAFELVGVYVTSADEGRQGCGRARRHPRHGRAGHR